MGYAVVSIDGIKAIGVCGYHRWDKKDKADTASLQDYFHLGSNTKAITSLIAAWLVAQRQIDWNTRFFDRLPELEKGSNSYYGKMTLSDLLSHRAGIQPFTAGSEFQKLPLFKGSASEKRKQFAGYLLKQSPALDTSKAFVYSNAGYSLAALMLEQASGKTWEALVAEVLGKQLKLHYRIGWPNKADANQPWGHIQYGSGLQALPGDVKYDLALIEPAGDIAMPLQDYARLIQLHLQGLEGKDNFIPAAAYEYLHYGRPDYAMGWGNRKKEQEQFSEHAGSAGTFFCYTVLDKQKGLAYIVIANAATEKAQNALFALVRRLKALPL